jgi:uncharacterized membrane protein YqjE
VLHDIVGNVQDIVRSELLLVRTELREEVAKNRSTAVWLAAGTLMVIFCALFLLLGSTYALSEMMPRWAAALAVGLVIGAAGALCVGRGIKKSREARAVPKTAASLQENVEWAKQPTR